MDTADRTDVGKEYMAKSVCADVGMNYIYPHHREWT